VEGEGADFISDDGEAGPSFSGAGGFYRDVEGRQIGLESEGLDCRGDLFDGLARHDELPDPQVQGGHLLGALVDGFD